MNNTKYTQAQCRTFSELRQEFFEPAREFSPHPFWFWNDEITKDGIRAQMAAFRDKGVYGFVIHPRLGVPKSIPFLSDRFMELVEFALEEARRTGMRVILYDEAMYPSGAGGGEIVRRRPDLATRGLYLDIVKSFADWSGIPKRPGSSVFLMQGVCVDADGTVCTSVFDPIRDESEALAYLAQPGHAVLVFTHAFTLSVIRGIHYGQDAKDPDAPAYTDLLNPETAKLFIEIVYEAYYRRFHQFFGDTVVAVFTDEAGIGKTRTKGWVPWTGGFIDCVRAQGISETDLALLWLEDPRSVDVRKKFRRAVNLRMQETYYGPISRWCEAHGLPLTGHPAQPDEMGIQRLFQLPGQDVVWRDVVPGPKALEGPYSTLGKCSADAARHHGRRRNLNECLGAYGWNLTAAEMKWVFDWLLVRGVNLLCPHAFYYSLTPPRHLESPPDVGPGNHWWPYYKSFADYAARMSALMCDSRNLTSIAILSDFDSLSWRLAKPLFERQTEFNYLDVWTFCSDACRVDRGRVLVGPYAYDTLLLEAGTDLSGRSGRLLDDFIAGGGRTVVLCGAYPGAVSVSTPEEAADLVSADVPRALILNPPSPALRFSAVQKGNSIFYVLSNEGGERYTGRARLAEPCFAELWDAWEGVCRPLSAGDFELSVGTSETVVIASDPTRPPLETPSETVHIRPLYTLQNIHCWTVSGLPCGDLVTDRLFDWSLRDDCHAFGGRVTYTTEIIPGHIPEGGKLLLCLGRVYETAHVRVNGTDAGFRLFEPYDFDVTGLLRPGLNRLEIDVCNSYANRYAGTAVCSGLLGPVVLCAVAAAR